MKKNISLPKGTKDFSPIEIWNRNFLIDIIKNNFNLFGFYPIETPSFERITTLIDKYGDEGNYLIFKLLKSGNSLKKGISNIIYSKNKIDLSKIPIQYLSNYALRYDLTIPFMRYVSMNKNGISFPFKRYQIQQVWRAENPQKGRFREFYQCDADIISSVLSNSLWEEIEFIKLCDDIFYQLNLPVILYINHIDILKGIMEISGINNDLWKVFFSSLDKWNKIGKELVKKEMIKKGISINSFKKVLSIIDNEKIFDNEIKYLEFSKKKFSNSNKGKKGIEDIQFIINKLKILSLKRIKIKWNISLSRGMNYYTGIIWELVSSLKSENSFSIAGGGRYKHNLFGMKENFYGVGISFGLERIYSIMEKNNLFNKHKSYKLFPSKIMFINFGDKESIYAYKIINVLRKKGISVQLYPNPIKISKQFKFASDNNIPFVIIIGINEIIKKKIKVKNLNDRSEKIYNNINELINELKLV